MTKYIVLIDDDETTHAIVKGVLSKDINLISYFNLKEAMHSLEKDTIPSLVIIDRVLPDGDGIHLCSNMRTIERFKEVPIIFLSGKIDETDVVSGFFAGADDYLKKPVSPLELKARIHARLRIQNMTMALGKITIDVNSHRAFKHAGVNKSEIDLTRIELKLLMTLMRSPERIFTRDALITNVWGGNLNLNDRVIDTHISHLRKKIEGADLKIEALRGEGYRIKLDQKNQAA